MENQFRNVNWVDEMKNEIMHKLSHKTKKCKIDTKIRYAYTQLSNSLLNSI